MEQLTGKWQSKPLKVLTIIKIINQPVDGEEFGPGGFDPEAGFGKKKLGFALSPLKF